MPQRLLRPKWIVGTVFVLALAGLFIRLGFWQLDRLEDRKALNAIGEQRVDSEPADLQSLLETAGNDLTSTEYRRVVLSGEYDTTEEVLIRSQVDLGQAGFHVITPLVLDDGTAVLVNRGWVPLSMDAPPVAASPPPGNQHIEGWVHLTQTRRSLGPEDPPGDLDVFNRVDVARIGAQVPYETLPVYVVAIGERGEGLPLTVKPPDFSDEGPHLSYAIQWFGFAGTAVIGWFFLTRRKGLD